MGKTGAKKKDSGRESPKRKSVPPPVAAPTKRKSKLSISTKRRGKKGVDEAEIQQGAGLGMVDSGAPSVLDLPPEIISQVICRIRDVYRYVYIYESTWLAWSEGQSCSGRVQ